MLTLNDGRSELWQWDTGRKLTVDADCSQVHFSNKVFGRSIDVDVVDGIAIIPDILLQTDKELTALAFVGKAENGYTKISRVFKVNRRNKPADYVFTPTDQTTLGELVERLEKIEEAQDPDAIKNAVDYYLASNPIQIDEKDPTVPVWAKQPQKPRYTAAEVGAQPEGNYVKTVNGETPDKNGNVQIKTTDSWQNAILYTPQELTEEQKAQARENIGVEMFTTQEIVVPDYTNQIPISVGENGEIVGLVPKSELTNDGSVSSSSSDDLCVTGFIPVKKGDIIRICDTGRSEFDPYGLIALYDADKTINRGISKTYAGISENAVYGSLTIDGNVAIWDTSTITYWLWENFAWLRATIHSADAVVTINEELTESVKEQLLMKPAVKVTEENLELVPDRKPLDGKTVVCFGDSLFGMYRSADSAPAFVALETGATVHNVGFGGCRMAVHPTSGYGAFSMWALAKAVAENDWTTQDAQASSGDDYFPENLALLKSIDFNDVDIVVIHYGTNDFTSGDGIQIDNESDLDDYNTLCGALRYSIEKLLSAYPELRIYVSLPVYRYWTEGDSTSYAETYRNTNGKTIPEFVEALRSTAEEYNLPVIDGYYGLGINKVNASTFLSDGTHHNRAGRERFGRYIGANLISRR